MACISGSATPYAKAIDDGPDALVVGRPGNVQNSYDTSAERGFSATISDIVLWRRGWLSHRNVPIRTNRWLNALVNHWKFSSIMTFGSGRRLNATMAGDPNQRRQHLQRPPAGQ